MKTDIYRSKFFLPFLTTLTFLLASSANIVVGDNSWYQSIEKSSLTPASYVFKIVWPILYLLMGVVSYYKSSKIYYLYIFQLLLNGSWSWLFFYFNLPLIALIDIYLLIVINCLIQQKLITNKVLFLIYLPYLLWILYASYLNLIIVILN
ncbi:MAG: TspO/MBR family protein [Pseudomonadota bacterium]|nr:TspO/MBR family protein [Pseudomonadota bacterium]